MRGDQMASWTPGRGGIWTPFWALEVAAAAAALERALREGSLGEGKGSGRPTYGPDDQYVLGRKASGASMTALLRKRATRASLP